MISQIIRGCNLIISWNKNITSPKEYLYSDDNIEKMAASCMMLEAIGETVKKIHRINPEFLNSQDPSIPWKNIMGLRDKIAHGYFNLDEEIIFETSKKEIPVWLESLQKIKKNISPTP